MIHPGLVAQNRPARPGRGGIHRQHGHAQVAARQHQAEAFDEGGLADPRRARQPDPQRLPVRVEAGQQGQRKVPVIVAPAFDQGDRAGQAAPVARLEAIEKLRDVEPHDPFLSGLPRVSSVAMPSRGAWRPVQRQTRSAWPVKSR